MKSATIALVAAGFVASLGVGAASAADRVTDVDFLKANRCKGLAASIQGVVDPAALDAFVKSERKTRAAYIVGCGEEEFAKARREARSEDRRGRLTAELNGECQAFLASPDTVARQ